METQSKKKHSTWSKAEIGKQISHILFTCADEYKW